MTISERTELDARSNQCCTDFRIAQRSNFVEALRAVGRFKFGIEAGVAAKF